MICLGNILPHELTTIIFPTKKPAHVATGDQSNFVDFIICIPLKSHWYGNMVLLNYHWYSFEILEKSLLLVDTMMIDIVD